MFDSCLMSAKSMMSENPKRKKGEKNVLTHAFFLRLNRTPRFSHILKVSSLTALKRWLLLFSSSVSTITQCY